MGPEFKWIIPAQDKKYLAVMHSADAPGRCGRMNATTLLVLADVPEKRLVCKWCQLRHLRPS